MPFTANQSYNLLQPTRRSSVALIGANSPCLYTSIAVRGEVLYCGDIFLLHRLFQARSRGSVQTKTFRNGSEASSRAERRHGCVILVSNEPRCYHAATSERRRIQSRADNNIIALRGASIRRSQRGNSEAIVGEMGGNTTNTLRRFKMLKCQQSIA